MPGQEVRALTVREAALILSMNRNQIEHLCETGEILAEPFGPSWQIFDQRIEHFGRLDTSVGSIANEPDLVDALARIESLDLLTDSWVPDIIRHEDQLCDLAPDGGAGGAGPGTAARSGDCPSEEWSSGRRDRPSLVVQVSGP